VGSVDISVVVIIAVVGASVVVVVFNYPIRTEFYIIVLLSVSKARVTG